MSDRQYLSALIIVSALICILFAAGKYSVSETVPEEALFIKTDQSAGIYSLGNMGNHVSWVDLNSDGCLDFVASNTDQRPPNLYIYQNNCDGTFELLNENTGIPTGKVHIISSSAGDFDNDGLVDLVLGTNSFYMVPRLYKNLGEFNFIQANEFSNINNKSLAKSIVFVDYNLDGYLDIFQASFKRMYLYTNDGRGFFSELSQKSKLTREFRSLNSGHWFDYNNDKYPDLFLSVDGYNRLYRNNKDSTFSDVSKKSGVMGDEKWDTVAACSGDIDNDGDMDFYIANIGSKRNALYRNNGDGTFTDITLTSHISGGGDGRTCSIIDYNADGLNDIYTTNHIRPSKLYKNLSNNKFKDVAYKTGIDEPVDAFTISWGDYNGDAMLDVILNGHFSHALYQGSTSNNSVIIEIIGDGVNTNTSAIGSTVELVLNTGMRQTKTVLGGRGCCEHDMLPLHFGLGNENEFDIKVDWTSGKSCKFENLNADNKKYYKVWEKDCRVFSY